MGRRPAVVLVAVAVLAVCSSRACASTVSGDQVLLLRQYVLDGLGLTRVPDTANMNISEVEYATKYESYLQAVRENRRLRQQRDTYTHTTAQRFRSYAHLAGAPYVRDYNGSNEIFYFPVDESNATVNQATLRLFAVGPLGEQKQRPREVTLRVFQVREGPRTLLDSKVLRLHRLSRWVEINVAPAVESWIAGQARNLGLEVECDSCREEGVRVLAGSCSGQDVPDSFCPVLNLLLTEREPIPRSPRAMGGEAALYDDTLGTDCRKGPNHGRCCRHSMEVVFKDVPGFEFILQPYKFNAGFCKGRCPPRYHPASQHALLQSLVWRTYHAPRPCCAPHVLADIEVLHLDETDPSTLKVSTWKGMQVQRCACS